MAKAEHVGIAIAAVGVVIGGAELALLIHHEKAYGDITMWIVGAGLLFVVYTAVTGCAVWLNVRDAHRAKKVEITAASKMEELLSLMGKMKQAGGQAALLFCFAGWADDLAKILEQAWHHWNNAGEKFV